MTEIYPFTLFILIGMLWCAAWIQSHRLFYKFRVRHPDHASEIPFAFSTRSHPEKIFYFYRKKNIAVLKSDPVIWALRKQVKVLGILSLAVPFTGFGIIICIALYSIFIYQQ